MGVNLRTDRVSRENPMNSKLLQTVAGMAMIAFPLLLLTGFLMHPDLLSFGVTSTAQDLVANFHHQPLFHIGHILVFIAVPLIIVSVFYLLLIAMPRGERWTCVGGLVAIAGSVILAGDKGALCIVLSAFDTLSESEFAQIMPALSAIVERRGLLAIFLALPLLPLGAAAQLVGLMRGGVIRPIPGIAAIVGLVLLNNPDIELISSVGAILMCFAYLPLGMRTLRASIRSMHLRNEAGRPSHVGPLKIPDSGVRRQPRFSRAVVPDVARRGQST
jgi:hypothetical protein